MNLDVELTIDTAFKWSKTATDEIKRDLAVQATIAEGIVKVFARTKHRVGAGHQYADRPTAGPRKHKSFYVNDRYAELAGVGGKTKWKSSREFHAAIRNAGNGAGYVTGGMWSGLQARNYGDQSVQIEFGGSTLGASSRRTAITKRVGGGAYEITLSTDAKLRAKQTREYAKNAEGEVKYRKNPKLVTNRLKAYTVFRTMAFNPLQLTDPEERAIFEAFRRHADIIVRGAFGSYLGGERLSDLLRTDVIRALSAH